MAEEYKKLQQEFREKEQENRISTLKVKELKRMIRSTKLKPVDIPQDETLNEKIRALEEQKH